MDTRWNGLTQDSTRHYSKWFLDHFIWYVELMGRDLGIGETDESSRVDRAQHSNPFF